MKLRVKMPLLVVIIVTIAIILCVLLIIGFLKQNVMDNVVSSCASDYQRFLNTYINICLDVGDKTMLAKNSYLIYQFRNISDSDEFVLQTDSSMLFNNTGIDAQKSISQGNTNRYLLNNSGEYAQYKTVKVNGEFYFIISSEIVMTNQEYYVSLVRNINDTMASIDSLAIKCYITGAIIIITAALLILIFSYHSLRPVKNLQMGAVALAEGRYESRIKMKGKDELAELADSFNKMADAIEFHIHSVENTSEERKMLLSALSHEMKTPVTSITGYSHALMRSKMTDEQKEEAIYFIDKECNRLERLSSKLMQLIYLQHKEITLKEISSDSIFNELRTILMPIADKENTTLLFDGHHEIINAEFDLVICLITNLFDNSRKAGAKNITISANNNILMVADNGKGIASEYIEKIIQPFYIVEKTRHSENFGLGLALCKKIADLHNAELLIKSELNKGTLVQIIF